MPSPNSIVTVRGVPLASRPARILLAEDDAEMRALLADALRNDGHEVVEARHGAELMQLLAARLQDSGELERVDLVVSDVRMPGWSGLEILEALRGARALVPVILITAFGGSDVHSRADDLGAVVVFDKPFDVDDLRTAVVHALAP